MTPSKSATRHRPTDSSRTTTAPAANDPEPASGEFLSLLADDYVREIVEQISDESLPARTIADRLEVARSTVYRRLNRLEEAGVLHVEMSCHPDGHHRKRFTISLDEVVLSFDDGIAVDRIV